MTINNYEMCWTIFIWIGLFVGSIIGSAASVEFLGASIFSLSNIIATTVGGFIGISAGYKISRWMS